jgi:hypothetical protein
MARKHNYLNNKDLLREIHKSKNSYCIYRDKENDHDFDMILESAADITKSSVVSGLSEPHPASTDTVTRTAILEGVEVVTYNCTILNIQIAKDAKAKRTAKFNYDAAIKAGDKVKQAEFAIDPDSYSDSDVIFRVNTFEHIPLAPPKVLKVKPKRKKVVESALLTEEDDFDEIVPKQKFVKVNFPPFFHYRYENDELIMVGKSHWKGSYDNGAFTGTFSTTHGNMTEKLAMMYMKLCERYATKANWRGYTYNDEMRGQGLLQLSLIGLQFNEAKSQNPFAYYTAVVNNAFTRVLNIEKRNQIIRDNILESHDLTPSYTRQNENEMSIMKNRQEREQRNIDESIQADLTEET